MFPITSIPTSKPMANVLRVVSNNFYDSDGDGILDGTSLCVSTTCYSDMDIVSSQFNYPRPSNLLTPQAAVSHVINRVGASTVRDVVDTTLIAQLQSYGKSGAIISDEAFMGGVGSIASGTVPKDTDGDGIPDDWEVLHGLNANDVTDGMEITASGYTNLEIYVNSLVPSTYP
jgi:hypothetical protein